MTTAIMHGGRRRRCNIATKKASLTGLPRFNMTVRFSKGEGRSRFLGTGWGYGGIIKGGWRQSG